jgi:hypothetical protein
MVWNDFYTGFALEFVRQSSIPNNMANSHNETFIDK